MPSSATPTASLPPATPGIPLFRFGFPVFDRVNKHRYPIIGYQGVVNMVTEICNKFIDIKDETCEDRYFEMMRRRCAAFPPARRYLRHRCAA